MYIVYILIHISTLPGSILKVILLVPIYMLRFISVSPKKLVHNIAS